MNRTKKIIVAITGASGSIYGIRMIEALVSLSVEVHLVISKNAKINIEYETDYSYEDVIKSADYCYHNRDFTSKIASGSFKTDGMIVAPCSIKSMSQIASGNIDSLTARAADVVLKERRKLVLMVRESPLHLGHLRNLTTLTEMGAIIVPPMPAMYILPKSIDDIINNTIGRIIDLFNIENDITKRWNGI